LFGTIKSVFGAGERKSADVPVTTSTLVNPDAWFTELVGAASGSTGMHVTSAKAMTCTAVRCAVLAISEAVGQLPLHVYDRETRKRATVHPAEALLTRGANDWTPTAELVERLTADAMLYDVGGVAQIVRTGAGKPFELHRIDPATVTLKVGQAGEPYYEIASPTDKIMLPHTDVLHIRPPGGKAPASDAREAIAIALTLERHTGKLFANGARPSGVLTFPQGLGVDVVRDAKNRFSAANSGDRAYGTAALFDGVKFTPVTFSSVDAQLQEMRKFAVEEISRAFRISPIFLQNLDRATWSNLEETGQAFLSFTLLPWLRRWEGELRLKLIAPAERERFYPEFTVDGLARADLSKRSTSYASLIASRVLSPNEARAMENRPPYAGGDTYENPNTSSGAAS